MAKETVLILLFGIAVASGFAVWMYIAAPQGTLLYTPAPGIEPNYTSSLSLGFSVATFCLSVISALIAIFSFVSGMLFKRHLLRISKQAAILLLEFGLLCTLSIITEPFWL